MYYNILLVTVSNSSHSFSLVDLKVWNFCISHYFGVLQLFIVELWANMHQTYDMTLLHWPLTFDFKAHVSRCGLSYSIPVPSLKIVEHTTHFCLSIYRPRDLNLSTSKWGYGSYMSWASFLPIFSLLGPSILNLGSGTWQTKNGCTERRRPSTLYVLPYGDISLSVLTAIFQVDLCWSVPECLYSGFHWS